MNVAFGKIGQSVCFDFSKVKMYAGAETVKLTLFALAERHPEHTFYIVGPSDFTRYKIDNAKKFPTFREKIPSNIVDSYGLSKIEFSDIYKHCNHWKPQIEWFKKHGVEIDLGIFFQGIDTIVSVDGMKTCQKGSAEEYKVAVFGKNYCAPYIALINEFGFKWYGINEDPRMIKLIHFDIFNDEEFYFSQINTVHTTERAMGYGPVLSDPDHHRKHDIIYKYSGVEKLPLMIYDKVDFTDPNNIRVGNKVYKKSNKFIMTLNEGPDRFSYIKKWVLDREPDTIIYGRWNTESIPEFKKNFVDRKINDMPELMWSSMFTYVPTFQKTDSNFVTNKPWKMIYFGIIPFWDKNSYDTDGYLTDFPDYFKVASPEEMWDKIDYLYDNRDEYIKWLKYFDSVLKESYFNGDFAEELFGPLLKSV